MIFFAPFEPDKPLHDPAATSHVNNVRPVAGGWAPLKTLVPFSEALPAEPRGYIAVRTAGGTQATFVGTETALYKLSSAGAWEDVSSTTYALPAGAEWSFDLFGDRVIASNVADGVFYYDVGSSTDFAALAGTPPKAKYVSVVGDFVWLLGLDTDDAGYAFSGLNNSEEWTPGTNFSDSGTFPDGGEIMGCVSTVGGCFILQRNMIRQAVFNPSSGFTFTTSIANERTGCVAPLSISKIGPADFVFLSQDGFYRGVSAQPIGAERVDRTFKDNVSASNLETVKAAADPDEKMVYFRYVKTDGQSSFLIYDWQLDRWSQSDQNVSGLGTIVTSSLTLEDLDVLFPDGIDSVSLSVDSAEFSGGRPALAGFSADWRVGYFTGPNLEAQVQTGTLGLNSPQRSFVRGVQVVGDVGVAGPGSFDNTELPIDEIEGSVDDYYEPTFYVKFGTADFHSQELTWGSESSPNFYTGIVPFRSSGRLHRANLRVLSSTTWSHLTALDIDVIGEGNR